MRDAVLGIYESGTVVGRSGKTHTLHSAIDPEEGQFLFDILGNDPRIVKTLEIGCAYGLSSLHICMATNDRDLASHTIIDPNQNTTWDGVGVTNLEKAGIDFFNLIEERSEFALPRLLDGNEGQFDFVFIDGWHTFDHTLLDCFYATRLLRIGGVLAIDDASFPSVRRVVNFIKLYPCYEEVGSVSRMLNTSLKKRIARILLSPINRDTWATILAPHLHRRLFEDREVRMVALKKVKEDTRDELWHPDSF